MYEMMTILLPKFVGSAAAHILSALKSVAPYLIQLLLGAVAFAALLKDWREYGKLSKKFGKYVRLGLTISAVVITVLGIQETYQARADARSERQQAVADQTANQAVITQLTSQVQQLRDDNQKNTDGFMSSFDQLYSKFSALQSRVQNKELLREIGDTKQQLLETQKKLTTPKAAPIGSFPTLDASQIPKNETTLSREGTSVTVQFIIYNPSDVPALNGGVMLRICEICKYAEEPAKSVKVPGNIENDREIEIAHIFARSATEVYSVKVTLPPGVNRFAISTLVACDTCVPPIKQDLWVTVK